MCLRGSLEGQYCAGGQQYITAETLTATGDPESQNILQWIKYYIPM